MLRRPALDPPDVRQQLLAVHAAGCSDESLCQLATDLRRQVGTGGVQIRLGDTELHRSGQSGSRGALRELDNLADGPASAGDQGRWPVQAAGAIVGELRCLPDPAAPLDADQLQLLDQVAQQLGLAFGYLQLERDARDTHRRLVDEQAERRLADRAFDLMFDESSIGMATLSLSTESPGVVLGVNDALCQLVGRSENELLDHAFAALIHPDDRATSNSALRRAVAGRRTPIRSQPRLLRADGNPIQVQLTACPLLDDEDRPRYALLQIQDLSAQPTMIAPEAALDPLAAMPAGAPLDQAMQSTLDRIGRLNTAGVALVCDLDGLIAAADRGTEQILRRSVAGVLRQSLRGDDLIGRISQNRFVVLAEEVPSEHAETVARRITDALHERGLTVQIGISLMNRDIGDARVVVKRATSAMFGARAAGVPYLLYTLCDGVLYSSTEEEATVRRQVLYAKPGWREH